MEDPKPPRTPGTPVTKRSAAGGRDAQIPAAKSAGRLRRVVSSPSPDVSGGVARARGPLEEAFETSVKAATHLTDLDKGTVEAARALARKIDAWDVIVLMAQSDQDAMDKPGRPKVPENDNTSLPTYLRYMDALKLTPASRGVEITESKARGKLATMRAARPA